MAGLDRKLLLSIFVEAAGGHYRGCFLLLPGFETEETDYKLPFRQQGEGWRLHGKRGGRETAERSVTILCTQNFGSRPGG